MTIIPKPSARRKREISLAKYSKDLGFFAGIVYAAQGALGVSAVSLPIFMRNLGWSISEITAVSSIAVSPWVLKILYGLVSDTIPLFNYRRKSYLILSSLLAACGWALLAGLPVSKLSVILSLVMANLGFAATDVVTDGLIVENSTKESAPIYQGIAWGSRSFGAVLSGISGGWLAGNWEPRQVFIVTAILPLFVFFAAWRVKEGSHPSQSFQGLLGPFKRCFRVLLGHNLKHFMGILVFITAPSLFGLPFFFHMKENLGFSELFMGSLISLGWGGAMLGSFIYVKWFKKVSPSKMLYVAVLLNAVNAWSTLLIAGPATALVWVTIGGVLGCLTLLPIMSSSAILSSQTEVEGTLFAVLMSIYNLGQICFGFLGGRLFESFGIVRLIVLGGALGLLSLLWIRQLDFNQVQET